MALNHLKICSKCTTFVWGSIADRSRIIRSAALVSDPISKDEAVISRFFMKPFAPNLSERSKIRHCSIAVKSIVRAINFWFQLGVQKISIRISDRFKTKLIYELYDYCDSPDSRPVNVLTLDSLITLMSKQTSFNFSQVMFALNTFTFKQCLPPRSLALAQQIVTSIALIIDSMSYFITFLSIVNETEEELTAFLKDIAKNSTCLREYFEKGFKGQLPSNLSLEISNQGVLVTQTNHPILRPTPQDSDENYTLSTTQPLNLIQQDKGLVFRVIRPTPTTPTPTTPTLTPNP
jgi:hypothetical protein